MKRQIVIFERLSSPERCKIAIWNASEHKRDRPAIARILGISGEETDMESAAMLEQRAEELSALLRSGDFHPAPYNVEQIVDGASKKTRTICKPKFWPDQCVHWCVMLEFMPVINRGMYYWSCGSIPGRGPHHGKRAIERWKKNDRKNTKWVLQMDFRHFYQSIKKDILKKLILRRAKGAKAISLLFRIIDSWPEGLPLGNYTSQWLANFLAEPIDHFIKENLHIKYYVRYVDDLVLFCKSKKALHRIRAQLFKFAEKTMGLVVKGNWQVYAIKDRAVDFLGYRFFRDYTILRKRNAQEIRAQTRRMAREERVGKKPTFHEAAGLLSRLGQLKHCDHKTFWDRNVAPFVNIKQLKGVVRNESKKRQKTGRNRSRSSGQWRGAGVLA